MSTSTEKCAARSEHGDVCALDAHDTGSHVTESDERDMCFTWGAKVDPNAVTIPCPWQCGMTSTVPPGELRGIVHNADDSHTLTHADGGTFTMHVAVESPRHLNAV